MKTKVNLTKKLIIKRMKEAKKLISMIKKYDIKDKSKKNKLKKWQIEKLNKITGWYWKKK